MSREEKPQQSVEDSTAHEEGSSVSASGKEQTGKMFFQQYPLPSFFLLLLVIGSLGAIYWQGTREVGSFATVRVSGEDWLRVDVSSVEGLEEYEIVQSFPTGEAYHRLVVGQGEIRIVEANCPDQVCVLQGGAVASGRPVVCLPYQVVITMEQKEEFDAVTG